MNLALALAVSLGSAFAAPRPASEEPDALTGLRVLDSAGGVHVLGSSPGSHGLCVVLLALDCPIATESLPELDRLARLAASLRIEFFGLISDPFALPAEIQRLTDSTRPSFPLLVDANGVLARRLRPTATPEAFLFDAAGELAYRGRIDDRARRRIGINEARSRELQDALDALGHGRPVPVARTGAIGCAFEGWPELDTQSSTSELTWACHVAPILTANCSDCHRAGGAAPFALDRYEDAARRSKMIARVALERTMPPWHAVPNFGDLRGVRRLDEREIRVLEQWSLSGAPRGEEDEALPPLSTGSEPERPDLVLELPEPIAVPADGPDLFQELALPPAARETLRLRAVDFRFSEPRVLRSALLFAVDPGPDADATSSRRQIASWVPGTTPDLACEAAWFLPETSRLSLRLHIHPSGLPTEIHASIALWTAAPDSDERVLLALRTSDAELTNDGHAWSLRSEHRLEHDSRILGLIPRLDPTGMHLRIVAHPPDGAEVPLLWITGWDPFWPETYRLRRPLDLPRGTLFALDARIAAPGSSPAYGLTPLEPLSSAHPTGPARCYLELAVPTQPAGSRDPEPSPH